MDRRHRRFVTLLALFLLLLAAASACSDDSQPGREAGEAGALQDGSSGADATGPCQEGAKNCPSLGKVMVCQGGQWVDLEDCAAKQVIDAAGTHACTCSFTLGYICVYGGKPCP